ncbi:hypothetical protein DPSP01_002861 [Paraphaeosphaeria sporulosa]|uniref:Uncharacterized protein n=1 Tax=Paraphaeosphaeria sporulosa TaxID=1460663 RepID=A0A177CFT1_9PLEO|nr:uncharacterized protein CC84DRAFT_1259650 [Paraphaeosphaeria sporulosa]OAG06465.1 hypothetical protein CC84DRAFT_1259650 [Paraphaeosphaeria sporulosa]
MASVLIPIIPLEPISRAPTFSSTFSYASTMMTATRAAAVIPTTSNFVLSPTAGGSARRPTPESSQTIALAIVVPLIALIAFISVIVFRMYRSRKEREEAAAAEAARAKTRAIEQQIYDMQSISEKYNLKNYQVTSDTKEVGNGKDISIDIPIELEADEPEKRRYHGL